MKINQRNKKLYIFYVVLAGLLFLTAFFLSQYLYLYLENGEIDIWCFLPHKIIYSIATNTSHLTLFGGMCLLIVFGYTYFLTSNNHNTFHSEMDMITPDIQTPRAMGQGQYGTAKWLKKSEIDNTFDHFTIDSEDDEMKALLIAGQQDQKAVKSFNAKIFDDEFA